MIYAEKFGGLGLREASLDYNIKDLADKFSFGKEPFSIGQIEVSKHVAASVIYFNLFFDVVPYVSSHVAFLPLSLICLR